VQEPSSTLPSAISDPLSEVVMAMDRAMVARAPDEFGDSRPQLGVIEGGATARNHGIDATARRPGATVWWRLPAAAALMFTLGNVTGYFLTPSMLPDGWAPTAGILVMPGAQEALDRALTGAVSGQELVWSDRASGLSGRVLIVSTHRLDDGAICREYQISTRDRGHGTIVGASCRRGGHWRTEIALTVVGAGSDYTPASDLAAVEDYLTNRGSGGPLAAENERALIDRSWQAPRE
jgi:hypothetical protein